MYRRGGDSGYNRPDYSSVAPPSAGRSQRPSYAKLEEISERSYKYNQASNRRRGVKLDDDYFEDDDDDNNDGGNQPQSSNVDDDEEDPLDAFMNGELVRM